MNRVVAATFFALAISACAGAADDAPDGARICTANKVFGIWVHVSDRQTGAPLSGAGGQVTSGTYVDNLRDDGAGDGVYVAATEHPGIFSVRVEHAGYSSKDTNNVVVTAGVCHVTPTVLYDTLAAVQ